MIKYLGLDYLPCIRSIRIDHLKLADFTLGRWWQFHGVNTLNLHRQVIHRQIIPDSQVLLTALEHVLNRPLGQALLSHLPVFDAAGQVSIERVILLEAIDEDI